MSGPMAVMLSPIERAARFTISASDADRILVEKKNALGEYDVETFSPLR